MAESLDAYAEIAAIRDELEGHGHLLDALLALLIDERQSRVDGGRARTEVLLHRCGVPTPVIAQVMDMQVDTVRKIISHAGATRGA
jgi:hypothetical protein